LATWRRCRRFQWRASCFAPTLAPAVIEAARSEQALNLDGPRKRRLGYLFLIAILVILLAGDFFNGILDGYRATAH